MRRFPPAVVLLLVAPAVAELLIGNVPLTRPAHLALDVGLYGCGALLIREVVRRRGLGWPAILVLGAAYAVVEEGLLLETVFNPAFPVAGGCALGVSWVYAEWAVGYHAVWSVAIPILLAESLFPDRRREAWLGPVGAGAAAAGFGAAALAMALRFRFDFASYTAPPALLAAAAALALGLVALALVLPARRVSPGRPPRPAPARWALRLLGGLGGVLWFALDVAGAVGRGVPAAAVLPAGLLLAAGTALLVRRWSAPGRGWSGGHSLALASGALAASLLFGLLVSSIRPGPATAVQLAVTAAAVALLVALARRPQPPYSVGAGAVRLGPDRVLGDDHDPDGGGAGVRDRDPALVATLEADRPART
jgi:hypothetical protein